MQYSKRLTDIGSASSIEQNELVYKKIRQGKNPIILSYGEAPFKLNLLEMQSKDWDRGCHYSEGLGVPEFRQEVKSYIKETTGVDVSPDENILVSAGSKIISYFICQAVLNEGDELLLHEPSWVSYQEHAKLNGAKTYFLAYDRTVFHFEELYRCHPKTKLIFLNNPNNPRGYVYKKNELMWLATFCLKNDIYLALDESYSDFVLDEEFFSGINLLSDFPNVVVFNSISKNFGLSGWRIGYCVGNQELIKGLNKFNQHLITCAPTCLQLALVGRLNHLRNEIRPQLLALNQKRKLVLNLVEKYGFKYLPGSATFYIFIDISDKVKDTKTFVIDFLDKFNVSFIPGGAYGISSSGFLRLSFAIESLSRIEEALFLLRKRLDEFSLAS